jgi:hypothetical protein
MMALDGNVLEFTVPCYTVRVDELFESHVRSRVVAVDECYGQIKNYRVTRQALFEAFRVSSEGMRSLKRCPCAALELGSLG